MGSIILVGAGPGDAELLTVKAVKALQCADVILYDALVSNEVLDIAHVHAKKIAVGKKGHGPSCRQDDINIMMVEFARAGKCVVRLKGGDPLIFSRAGEEMEAARVAGITVEIIPGVTAAQGSAAALGVPLTHRYHARRLQFVTGHDHNGELPIDIYWPALADPAVTTVIYMAKKTLDAFSAILQQYGLAHDTPAAAVFNASLSSEHIIRATIATLPALVISEEYDGPVTVIVGQVLY